MLPDRLAPTLSPAELLDVLGTSDPWVIPDGWTVSLQQQFKVLSEDPRGIGGLVPAGS